MISSSASEGLQIYMSCYFQLNLPPALTKPLYFLCQSRAKHLTNCPLTDHHPLFQNYCPSASFRSIFISCFVFPSFGVWYLSLFGEMFSINLQEGPVLPSPRLSVTKNPNGDISATKRATGDLLVSKRPEF